MKTFKMLSLEIVRGNETKKYPLTDGIIINQENSHRSWILEMYLESIYAEDFIHFLQTEEILDARVVISYPDNEPAPFRVVVCSVKDIGDRISVLLKGTLKAQRTKYAEQLLAHLMKEGLTGDELLASFSQNMRLRPQLKE